MTPALRKYFSNLGKLGGKAKAKSMTAKQRSEHGKKMVMARIAKGKTK